MGKAMATAAKRNKGEAAAKIEAVGIRPICEMILDDMSYAEISAKIGVSKATLVEWIGSDPDRSARARDARVQSARRCDELALEALNAIDDDAPAGQIARQREIASHYRWRAKTRNPASYGDALKVDGKMTVEMTQDQVDKRLALLLAKAKDVLAE